MKIKLFGQQSNDLHKKQSYNLAFASDIAIVCL